MRTCKNFLSDAALKTLYFSIFHCHLSYAILAWGTANKTAIDPIIKKQKNAIRIISRAPYNAHTEPLFKKHGILRFEDLHTFCQLEFFHSFTQNKLPKSFDGLWSINGAYNPVAARLRRAETFFVPRARLNFSARFPLHAFPKLWNEFLDPELKNTVSVNVFKDGLKNYFLNDLAANVYCGRAFCRDCFPNQEIQ